MPLKVDRREYKDESVYTVGDIGFTVEQLPASKKWVVDRYDTRRRSTERLATFEPNERRKAMDFAMAAAEKYAEET